MFNSQPRALLPQRDPWDSLMALYARWEPTKGYGPRPLSQFFISADVSALLPALIVSEAHAQSVMSAWIAESPSDD